jgi:hypothetical protein
MMELPSRRSGGDGKLPSAMEAVTLGDEQDDFVQGGTEQDEYDMQRLGRKAQLKVRLRCIVKQYEYG